MAPLPKDEEVNAKSQRRKDAMRKAVWLVLILALVASVVMVLIPVWLIHPFRRQTPSGIDISFILRRWSPFVTVISAAGMMAAGFWLWRGTRRWWAKSVLVAFVLFALAPAWAARQNHFEWMFNPLPNAGYVSATQANFIADNDMVLGVEINGEAVAYPVRQMAYHHVVHDSVGGKPIVATY